MSEEDRTDDVATTDGESREREEVESALPQEEARQSQEDEHPSEQTRLIGGAEPARPTWRPYAVGAAVALLAVGLFFSGYLVGSLGDDDDRGSREAISVVPRGAGFDFRIPDDIDPRDLRDSLTDRDDRINQDGAFLGVAVAQTDDGAVTVESVEPGSAAADAGVRPGDLILAVDGEGVESVAGLARAIGDREPGTEIELTIERGGEERTLDVTLGSRA